MDLTQDYNPQPAHYYKWETMEDWYSYWSFEQLLFEPLVLHIFTSHQYIHTISSVLTILSFLSILSFAHFIIMFPSTKLWIALTFIVSVAASSLDKRGSSVIIGYRTVSTVRRDFQYEGHVSWRDMHYFDSPVCSWNNSSADSILLTSIS